MSETDRLQAEAANRARDMYRRSQNYNANTLPNGYNGNIRDTRASKSSPDSKNNANSNSAENIAEEIAADIAEEALNEVITANQKSQSKSIDIFDSILQDKERTLIILLIILLSEEKANTSLVLALMYLIM